MIQIAPSKQGFHRLSVAPMMNWTDRHCRFIHRLMTKRALLYTEMVTAAAIVHGDLERLLAYDAAEHPLVLQLGGSDPPLLAKAVQMALPYGYDGFNLNVGCPSERVKSGSFGAVLMESPDLVAACIEAMMQVTDRPVTVKCRIGVDDQIPEQILPIFLEKLQKVGLKDVIIHARKAWLKGLSPKENREIPTLDYGLVHQMKAEFPHMTVSINGGVATLEQARGFLDAGLDGVMIGRAAYHDPALVLIGADALWGDGPGLDAFGVIDAMRPYIAAHLAQGGRLNQITRHLLNLFSGRPGARAWRRILSENMTKPGVGFDVIDQALLQLRCPDGAYPQS
ncbi:MAG: tRNA-dihydrouridine synthase A [Paracoccaceae bacterium]|jgi:tRNA-dihydrouridine synthase A